MILLYWLAVPPASVGKGPSSGLFLLQVVASNHANPRQYRHGCADESGLQWVSGIE